MKNSVKMVAGITAALLLIAGCGKQSRTSDSAVGSYEGEAEEITFPLTEEPITLSYFVAMPSKIGATMQSFNEIACYQEMEKLTGIHIDFIHPPVGQEREKFNLMISSGQIPDMIEYDWINKAPGGPMKAISEGTIEPLNDLINQYAPNLKKLLSEEERLRKEFETDDSQYYCFPAVYLERTSEDSPSQEPAFQTFGWQIRKDWLDKLGLPMPDTLEDWYTVLTAFKTQDPNGNGLADEIPFVSSKLSDITMWTRAFGITYDFYRDGDTVKYGPITPEYKECLKMLNKWYEEGLIDKDFPTVDGKQIDAKVTSGVAGAWNGATSARLGRYVQLLATLDPDAKVAGTLNPRVDENSETWKFDPDSYREYLAYGVAIGSDSKYKVEATKWQDYKYSEEGHNLFNYGIEGKSYVVENGRKVFTQDILNNPDGLSIDEALGRYAMSAELTAMVMEPAVWHSRMSLPEQQDAISRWKIGNTSRIMPQLMPTVEESGRMARMTTEINNYKDEMFTNFVMGKVDIDAEFDNYVVKMKSLNIDEALKIQQDALKRFLERK